MGVDHLRHGHLILLMASISVGLSGCASADRAPSESVTSAWQRRDTVGPSSPRVYRNVRPRPGRTPPNPASSADDAIATVNGLPISRSRVVDLLLRSRGAAVLEQLIGLETAMRAATARGVTISQADIDEERDRALRRLSDPLHSVASAGFDRAEAQRLLDTILAQRSMSRDEFDILTRRNAYLRKVVSADIRVNEEQLRREFQARYGPKFEVRHIQLATAAEAARLRERIDAGENFADLASRYSANKIAAPRGGLLEPFSAGDERVPALLRQTAAALQPGEVSGVVRIGEWRHLVKLERVLSTEKHDFHAVREQLENTVRERAADQAMRAWFEKLFREATIEIHDPVLAAEFAKVHPDGHR